MIAVVLVAAGCASVPTTPMSPAPARHVGSVVAWVDHPAPTYVVRPTPHPPPPPHDARPCRAGDMRLGNIAHNGAMGTSLLFVDLVITSRSTCSADGFPTISARTRTGLRRLRLHDSPLRVITGPPANVRTGQHVTFVISWLSACEGGSYRSLVYRRLVIGMPGGGTLPLHNEIDAGCDLATTSLGVPADLPPGPPPDPLDISVQLPPVLHVGSARFTVTLRNRRDRPFALTPCPTYSEFAASELGYVTGHYYLNCSDVSAIPPHGRLTFDMRLRLPPAMRGRQAKFGWALDGHPDASYAVLVFVA